MKEQREEQVEGKGVWVEGRKGEVRGGCSFGKLILNKKVLILLRH